ncbi:hypothetical protein [Parasphingorhabdus cellanae]|uniref:Uncharacterized protein n=1 Tax=Parasphingorhabdus cellanae TaxID=2806553 RepID=A0ABX7T4C8_9SPHN|nr:hypothetical protein [Parasphingorhabdus cellanae]QTD56438.1 hypothetical protein J4G78_02215 [Parasphingorhabdus cellanae]
MRNALLVMPILPLLLVACGEEPQDTVVTEEKLTEYKAYGTEPGWTVDIKNDEIIHTSQDGNNDFSLAVQRMKKTATGWDVKGFTDKDNISVTIVSGEECNDGMSDRIFADTVKVSVSGSGYHNGCGGEILSDPEAAEAT